MTRRVAFNDAIIRLVSEVLIDAPGYIGDGGTHRLRTIEMDERWTDEREEGEREARSIGSMQHRTYEANGAFNRVRRLER